MKLSHKIVLIILVLWKFLYLSSVLASTTVINYSNISINNSKNQAIIKLNCNVIPTYKIFYLSNPERIVIDFLEPTIVCKNVDSMIFNKNNLIKSVRTNMYSGTTISTGARVVLDLTCTSNITEIIQKKINERYCIILIILKKKSVDLCTNMYRNIFSILNYKDRVNSKKVLNIDKKVLETQSLIKTGKMNGMITKSTVVVVAIDAGHGGQDPGATGYCGIYEKNITINIAKKLKALLDSDPNFKAFMIRDGDYYLSISDRSSLARKNSANVLISIHADSAINTKIRGSSVWILSNRRAESEMMHWLQQCSEKHAELLGGLGDILVNYRNDPYFNHLMLDLQFGYAQQVGYKIAKNMLDYLKNINVLHKNTPEYSNFGILKSPDIPSILVETGFISNAQEEYLLSNNDYQAKIALALYKGLCAYFKTHQQCGFIT